MNCTTTYITIVYFTSSSLVAQRLCTITAPNIEIFITMPNYLHFCASIYNGANSFQTWITRWEL